MEKLPGGVRRALVIAELSMGISDFPEILPEKATVEEARAKVQESKRRLEESLRKLKGDRRA